MSTPVLLQTSRSMLCDVRRGKRDLHESADVEMQETRGCS